MMRNGADHHLHRPGYIGGDAFYALEKKHPDWDYTLLVRSEERAGPVRAKYPKANLVFGSLDDADVIEKAAAEADVVIREQRPSLIARYSMKLIVRRSCLCCLYQTHEHYSTRVIM